MKISNNVSRKCGRSLIGPVVFLATVLILVSVRSNFNSLSSRLDNNNVIIVHKQYDAQLSGSNLLHCITGEIIGHVDESIATIPFNRSSYLPNERSGSESSTDRRAAFKDVFDKRTWIVETDPTNSGVQSSGPGSTLLFAQEAIASLHVAINRIKAEQNVSRVRMLDVPCGDMAWMSRFLLARSDVDYVGFDIVPDLIQRHRKTFIERYPGWQFHVRDIVSDDINVSKHGEFNLVFSRHMLQHLKNADVLRVLETISQLGARQSTPVYLLTTTFAHDQNVELDVSEVGRFRRLNLELPPFSLQPPLCLVNDGPVSKYCCFLGLWRLPLRQASVCKSADVNIPSRIGGISGSFRSCIDWSLKAN